MSLRPNLEVWDFRVEICAVRQLLSGVLGGARVRAPGAAGGVVASRVRPRGLRSDPCSPGREFPHASGSPGPFPAKLSPRARAAVLWDGDEPAATALGALCLASPRIGLRNRAPSSASKSLEETLKHHYWPPFKCAFFSPRPPFPLASGVLSRALPATAAVVPASGPCGPSRRGARRADTHAPVCGSALAARLSLRCRPAPSRERRRPRGGRTGVPEGAAPLSPVLTHTLVRVSAFRVSRPPHPASDAFSWCRAARWPVPFSAMKRAQEAPRETD